jgi:hypothetical protein
MNICSSYLCEGLVYFTSCYVEGRKLEVLWDDKNELHLQMFLFVCLFVCLFGTFDPRPAKNSKILLTC